MLDTNICIYAMKRVAGLAERFIAHEGELCISAMTLAELHHGAQKSQRRTETLEELRRFLLPLEVIPFDTAAAAEFGELRASLEQAGTPCGPMDILIGAHARSLGMVLVTNNRREFDLMPGLQVENWV